MRKIFSIIFLLFFTSCNDEDELLKIDFPNILLIIADDLGNDALSGFNNNNSNPHTPTLDSLRMKGITFSNVWSSPVCSPTRAGLLTGKYGFKTNVLDAGDKLDENEISVQEKIDMVFNDTYSFGVIGKWHLSGTPTIASHPLNFNLDYYAGTIGGGVRSYYDYSIIENGNSYDENTYVTKKFTELAFKWIKSQSKPWFLWLSEIAPHTPFESPPQGTYSQNDLSTDLGKFKSSIESLDYYINQLFNEMDSDTKLNTLIIFLGDNGTDNSVLQGYPSRHGKGTLYEGGVRVPLIISGNEVKRIGSSDASLIQTLDIPALILNYIGGDALFADGESFIHLLSEESNHREFLFSESVNDNNEVFAVKNKNYKLLNKNGKEEFYYLGNNINERNDLLENLLNSNEKNNLEELREYYNSLK